MKMKKLCLSLLASFCFCTGCNSSGGGSSSLNGGSSNSGSSFVEKQPDLSNKTETQFVTFDSLDLEVNETFDLTSYLQESSATDFTFEIVNTNTASIDTQNVITGLATGETNLYIYSDNYYQRIALNVKEVGALSSSFTFEYGRMVNKKVLIFGDSVSYGQGLSTGQPKWWEIMQETLQFKATNYAVSGTTMTYAYEGSHIKEEYSAQGPYFNGVGFITSNVNAVRQANYIFIFYGHNDMYFQPPIGETTYLPKTMEECTTFKASYAYAINLIQTVNPSARIILITPNYSLYQPNPAYDIGLTYGHYNTAILDMAEYYHVRAVYLWDATKAEHEKQSILADSVHMNTRGHQIVANLILNMK